MTNKKQKASTQKDFVEEMPGMPDVETVDDSISTDATVKNEEPSIIAEIQTEGHTYTNISTVKIIATDENGQEIIFLGRETKTVAVKLLPRKELISV